MTKSLDALIRDAVNVEEEANAFVLETVDSHGCSERDVESYKAGAREVAERLGPALKYAIEQLKWIEREEVWVNPAEHSKDALEDIQSILRAYSKPELQTVSECEDS